MDCTVVIPVLNQLRYTQRCVESLLGGGTKPQSLLIIDNGSTDETGTWLASRNDLPWRRNPVNLGCGGAWTQGALASSSEWTVLLNNDVIAPPGFVDRLLNAAVRHEIYVVSPALVEGPLDYDFESHARRFSLRMTESVRPGWFHGVCFAVRRSVFEKIGFPDTDRRLGGREDVEFLLRCIRSGVAVGTVGAALLHHFGSVTQKALKQESGLRDLGDRRDFYTRVGMGLWARKQFKRQRRESARAWVSLERADTGYSMHMLRENGEWRDALYL